MVSPQDRRLGRLCLPAQPLSWDASAWKRLGRPQAAARLQADLKLGLQLQAIARIQLALKPGDHLQALMAACLPPELATQSYTFAFHSSLANGRSQLVN